METNWQTHSLENVMTFFIKGYSLPRGTRVVSYEWFIDTAQGKVVIALTTDKAEDGS